MCKKYNAAIIMDVILDGYFGDWKSGYDEAVVLSKTLKVPIKLNYAGQYSFFIYPEITEEEIKSVKTANIVIGV